MKIGFGVYYSAERRKRILDAIIPNDNMKRAEGMKILSNYRTQLNDQMGRIKKQQSEIESHGIRLDPKEQAKQKFLR